MKDMVTYYNNVKETDMEEVYLGYTSYLTNAYLTYIYTFFLKEIGMDEEDRNVFAQFLFLSTDMTKVNRIREYLEKNYYSVGAKWEKYMWQDPPAIPLNERKEEIFKLTEILAVETCTFLHFVYNDMTLLFMKALSVEGNNLGGKLRDEVLIPLCYKACFVTAYRHVYGLLKL